MGLPVKSDQNSLPIDRQDMGKADTLRYNVSVNVIESRYDRAIQDLKNFMETDNEFPSFHSRVERYIAHAIDLVNAIRAKRNFPGSHYLTMAKQQELNEKFREHFMELQLVLKKIEKIHIELRLEDVRSTVWVVRACVYSVCAILLAAVFLEISGGFSHSLQVVADDAMIKSIDWIYSKLPN